MNDVWPKRPRRQRVRREEIKVVCDVPQHLTDEQCKAFARRWWLLNVGPIPIPRTPEELAAEEAG